MIVRCIEQRNESGFGLAREFVFVLIEQKEVTLAITDIALEKHYTVSEIADRWHVDYSTARAMFENEPGVLRFGPGERRFKRSHVSLRVPESVMVRVHRALQRRAS